jgi:hypothetical protein
VSLSIIERLALRHSDAVFVAECKTGSSWAGCRRLDAWAMPKTWSPLTFIGYEVKVDRGDFLRDRKWQEYLPVCHELYFACPAKLIAPEELPQDVGLLWTSGDARLVTKRKAVRRQPEPGALVDLMSYVLMSRARIVGDMHEAANHETREQFWRRWLEDGAEAKKLGHAVGKRIGGRLLEAEDGRRRAERDTERLTAVREKLVALGLDGDASTWKLEERFGAGARTLRQIARLAQNITQLAEPGA